MTLVAISILTTIIHAVDTGSFAARLAGVRTGRLALAGSLYNVFSLVSRGANTFAAPLIGVLTDTAANNQDTGDLLTNFRVLLLAATAGTVVAGLLLPTLSRLLERGVLSYEQRRSLPRVIVRGAGVFQQRNQGPSGHVIRRVQAGQFGQGGVDVQQGDGAITYLAGSGQAGTRNISRTLVPSSHKVPFCQCFFSPTWNP